MSSEPSFVLVIGLLMLAGLLLGTWVVRFGAPRVLGYLVAGMLFSNDWLAGAFLLHGQSWTQPLVDFALAIVAYLIGGAVTTAQLRRSGRIIIGAAVGESLGAVTTVFLVMLWLGNGENNWMLALALAALAATTDPAGSVAIIHQYRSSGLLSRTLLGVAAMDDALGVLLYSMVLIGITGLPLLAGLWNVFFIIFGSILIGIVVGRGLSWAFRHLHLRELHLPIILAAILFTLGFTQQLGLSYLLAIMALGFTSRHALASTGERIIHPVERLEETVFLLFFTLAGTQFDVTVFGVHLGLVVAYFLARALGKVGGAYLGSSLMSAPLIIRKWLGLTLIPQAGISVGLAMALANQPGLHTIGPVIVNVVLANTFLCEAIGPLAARFALKHAGEIGEKREMPKI